VLLRRAVAYSRGGSPRSQRAKANESDVRVLNSGPRCPELEAIAAYRVGAESGLLQKKPVLDLAVTLPDTTGARRHPRQGPLRSSRQGRQRKGPVHVSTTSSKHRPTAQLPRAGIENGARSRLPGAGPVFGNRTSANKDRGEPFLRRTEDNGTDGTIQHAMRLRKRP